jgi:DNA-binding response OmpR family regulator
LQVQEKEKTVEISVVDNGRGIAPEFADKIFTNFFQVADHGIQNTGYGIGLALSKDIVELHEGKLTVKSEPAEPGKPGRTSFTVTLLKEKSQIITIIDKEETETESVIEKINEENGEDEISLSSTEHVGENANAYTLLIAEDNPALSELVKETFAAEYKLIICENGLQAWENAVELIPDLVISDVMMPVMDGIELCNKLKTDERTNHIPVILLTAKSSETDQVTGLKTGADIYVTKPFLSRVLQLNVRNLLNSRELLRKKFGNQITSQPGTGENEITTAVEPIIDQVNREFLEKVIRLVEEHMEDPEFGVAMLSTKVAMSQPVLYKKLKAVTNMSVNDFIKSLRLKRAAVLLAQKKMTVYEVAYAVGYNDRKYFSQEFKKYFGVNPSEYLSV